MWAATPRMITGLERENHALTPTRAPATLGPLSAGGESTYTTIRDPSLEAGGEALPTPSAGLPAWSKT